MAKKEKDAHQQLDKIKSEITSLDLPAANSTNNHNYCKQPTAPFKCKHCNRTFLLENILMKHLKIEHLIERPFECNICKKTFIWQSNLKNHLRSHSNEKNFHCKEKDCAKTFKFKYNMIAHMQMAHSGDLNKTMYESLCSESFKHKKRVKLYRCQFCEEKFYVKMACQSHLKVHLKKRALRPNSNREKTIDYSVIPMECVASEPLNCQPQPTVISEIISMAPENIIYIDNTNFIEPNQPLLVTGLNGSIYEILPVNDDNFYVVNVMNK